MRRRHVHANHGFMLQNDIGEVIRNVAIPVLPQHVSYVRMGSDQHRRRRTTTHPVKAPRIVAHQTTLTSSGRMRLSSAAGEGEAMRRANFLGVARTGTTGASDALATTLLPLALSSSIT